jgi:hypothetical protein
MNDLFKGQAAKISACYSNVDPIEKGGEGSGHYQHHRSTEPDTKASRNSTPMIEHAQNWDQLSQMSNLSRDEESKLMNLTEESDTILEHTEKVKKLFESQPKKLSLILRYFKANPLERD